MSFLKRDRLLDPSDVQWCYRTILRRAPESPDVIEHHRRKSDLRILITDLLSSREYAKVSATRVAQAMLPPDMQYLSLGSHCFSSAFLRRLGVRHWSGPFDWTFSSLPMVSACLNDDFRRFLDAAEYEPVPPSERRDGPRVNRVHHRAFRQLFGIDYVFNHHDVHLPEGYAYLTRCVERFRAALQQPQRKILLVTTHHTIHSLAELEDLSVALSRRTTNYRVIALLIDVISRQSLPVGEKHVNRPDLAVYTYQPASRWGATDFEDPLDETCLSRIFAGEVLISTTPPV